ncbi:hypothetical protein [Propionispira arboris]|uniref:hypothetical protein n=1 Tax=Propionispira arboris TaxID=84035 RepID=UPI0015A561BC|nr:hypothetical protein [Propionispira arboris]
MKNMLLNGLEQVKPKAQESAKEVPILTKAVKEPSKISPLGTSWRDAMRCPLWISS